MEVWAAVLHRWFWHGPMWAIHRSHHAPKGKWEANDALSVLHAPIAIILIVYGNEATPSIFREMAFGIGIGMTAFGLGYMIVHDGLVHGRLPVQSLSKLAYFAKIRDYHLIHHDNSAKGVPFGLFLGPWEHRIFGNRRTQSRKGVHLHES